MEITFERLTEAHAADLAPRMRAADVDEVWAARRVEPLDALLVSMRGSDVAICGLADGIPRAAFGARKGTSLSHGVGWALGDAWLDSHPLTFWRYSLHWRDQLLARFGSLRNVVDARNTASIRWLTRLGAEWRPAVPVGEDKLPFLPFILRR